MGCNASKTIPIVEDENGTKRHSTGTFIIPSVEFEPAEVQLPAQKSQSLAFEVRLEDQENLIKRFPPKRLQRLGDQQTISLTHELLEEKQAVAEQRRLQILNQRIQSARSKQKLKRTGSSLSKSEENGFLIENLSREPSTVEL